MPTVEMSNEDIGLLLQMLEQTTVQGREEPFVSSKFSMHLKEHTKPKQKELKKMTQIDLENREIGVLLQILNNTQMQGTESIKVFVQIWDKLIAQYEPMTNIED